MELKDFFTRFALISTDCMEAVENAAKPFCFRRSVTVVEQDKPCDYMFFFATGLLRIGLTKKGHEDTVAFGGAGDVFLSLPTFFSNGPSTFTLTTLDECKGWKISIRRWRDLEKKYPELIAWMRDRLGVQMHAIEESYRRFVNTTPTERLENFCNTYSQRPGMITSVPISEITRIIPLKYIAQYIGVTQQTLSKLRRRQLKNPRKKQNL